MIPVRQSTAFETAVGPVLDADGVAVTGCVVGDFKIKKTSGNFAALNASATLTHVSAGFYDLVLTTSDVDTVGLCCIAIDDTTNACAPLYLQVIEEAVYDALFAASAAGYQVPIWAAANSTVNLSATTIKTATDVETDTADIQSRIPAALGANGNIKADVRDYNGTAGTFSSGRPEVNTTHAAGTAWGSGAITAASIASDAFTAAKFAADCITAAKIANGAIDAATFAADVDAEILSYIVDDATRIDASALNTAAVTTIPTNLDAAITSRMATYTQPTGFLAATFPATVASTTNITAGTITTATNVTTVNGLAAGVITAAAIADGAIDRATFAADTGLQTIRSGTAQAGAAGSITLDASASSVTDFYDHCTVYITGGTGVGQHQIITAYNGTTKVALVDENWKTTPDNTSTFAIMHGKVDLVASSAVVSADISTIAGQAVNASGTVDFDLLDAAITSRMATYTQPTGFLAATFPTTVASTTNITAGTITTTTNLTNLPAITSNWLTATGLATSAVDEIVDAVWDEVQSGHTTAGTFGKYLDAQVSTVGGGTAAQIADAVWDEAMAGHLTAGSTGLKLNSAAAAGDPLENDVPGSYAAGTAGYVLGTIGAGDITMTNPVVDSDNNFTIIKGDDYYAADAREVEWTSASWPSLTSATIYFKAMAGIFEYQTTTGTASGSGTQVVTVNIPTSFTSNLLAGEYQYDLEAVLSNGHIVTLAQGTMTILAQVE